MSGTQQTPNSGCPFPFCQRILPSPGQLKLQIFSVKLKAKCCGRWVQTWEIVSQKNLTERKEGWQAPKRDWRMLRPRLGKMFADVNCHNIVSNLFMLQVISQKCHLPWPPDLFQQSFSRLKESAAKWTSRDKETATRSKENIISLSKE